ncbi:exonuclease subunit SbcD [Psychrosphaera sp. B3R10]|uniref:exonuclease subunit SbcD n=1 Tax=unclassified Psychrosphaera TaxID=2641570 RepID=UPI001C090213|nr:MULTISPECIES: exonuclease subunit SbcD [unclassified Psychrosphaera]MBU2883586.1 exonuclease subunit SbcD [Psychrosphaera sp. I2R16]MBU2989764.1 exonuclease subunit SbcD [Psychrosphaera sp. B3R10]
MKIIHTSDWHLGQGFIGKSREAEHKAFLNWLLNQVTEKQIDAVIVAGDIFDTGTPPSYARTLYNEFIVSMHKIGCQLVVLGGNHDSVATLNETESLLSCLGTYVIGGVKADLNDQVILLNDHTKQPGAILCGIPFIRPKDVLDSVAGQTGSEKQKALIQAMAGHFMAIFDIAEQQRKQLGGELPIISTGHLTTLASSRTESVREIYVGTLESFPSDKLPPADYIALGHIHKPMSVSGKEHIRYCGSPIPLSFDELNHKKQVIMVEFEGANVKDIEPLYIPRSQAMYRIEGSLTSIEHQLQNIAVELSSTDNTAWVEVEVSTDDYLSDLQQKILDMCSDAPIEIIKVKRKKATTPQLKSEKPKQSLSELTPKDVFQKRLEQEQLEPADIASLTSTFDSVVAEVLAGEKTDVGNSNGVAK